MQGEHPSPVQPDQPVNQPTIFSAAKEVFLAYLDDIEKGRDVDFEVLCQGRPELADALRGLNLAYLLGRRISGSSSLSAFLGKQDLKADEVTVTLDPGSVPVEEEATVASQPAGTKGHGRYEIRGELARGGMGIILRVRDRDLNRDLAMKVILEEGTGQGEHRTAGSERERLVRFLEEAQVTAQLQHPGIVPVHEIGFDKEGRVYFTMRLVKGKSLGEILEFLPEGGEWSLTRALGVLVKVCETMAYAHEKGVIHRDLKPSNVMVGRFGEVYVMDWGLAKVLGKPDLHDIRPAAETTSTTRVRSPRQVTGEDKDESDSPLITMDGTVVGTPAYMPPEQAEGRVDDVDRHADVYSLGAILYHLLTGQAPYMTPGVRISPRTILSRVLDGPPKPVHEIALKAPVELVAICEKAMARRIGDRYATSAELRDDLQAFLENRVVRAHRTGAVVELRKWVARNRGTAAGIAVAATIALAGMAAVIFVERAANDALRAETGLKDAARKRAEEEAEKAKAAEGRAEASASEARKTLATLYDEKGQTARATNRWGEATDFAVAALERDPTVVRRTMLARCLDRIEPAPTWVAGDSPPSRLAYRPDGKVLAGGCPHSQILLWDVATGKATRTIGGSGEAAVAFGPDGRMLGWAAGVHLCFLDLEGRAETVSMNFSSEDSIRSLVFSPDGASIAVVTDQKVVLKRTTKEKVQEILGGFNKGATIGTPLAMAFDKEGDPIVAHRFPKMPEVIVERPLQKRIDCRIGPISGPYLAALSRDGRVLALASEEREEEIRIVEVRTGLNAGCAPGHLGGTARLILCDDGTMVASAGAKDGKLRVCRVDSGKAVYSVTGLAEPPAALALRPDGSEVAYASPRDGLRIDSLPTGEERWRLVGHSEEVQSVSFLPDGTLETKDAVIAIRRDPATGRIVGSEPIPPEADRDEEARRSVEEPLARELGPRGSGEWRVESVSPDRTLAAIASKNGVLEIRKVPEGKRLAEIRPEEGWERREVIWGPEGRLLVVTEQRDDWRRFREWSRESGKVEGLLVAERDLESFFSDGSFLIGSGSIRQDGDRFLHGYLWVLDPDGRALADGKECSYALAPGGGRLLLEGTEGACLVDGAAGKRTLPFKGDEISARRFSPDGGKLYIGTRDGLIVVWDAASASEIGRLTLKDRTEPPEDILLSPGGGFLAVRAPHRVSVLDLRSGAEAASEKLDDVTDLLFRNEHLWAFESMEGDRLRLWHIYPKGIPYPDLPSPGKVVTTGEPGRYRFSPDGRWLAAPRGLWDSRTVEPNLEFSISALAADFTLDGRRLAAAFEGGDVLSWDLQGLGGIKLESFRAAAFSPGRRTLATVDARGDVRLYEIPSGQMVKRLPCSLAMKPHFKGEDVEIRFGPDERRLLVTNKFSEQVTSAGVIDIERGEVLSQAVLLPKKGMVGFGEGLVVSPDGRRLALVVPDYTRFALLDPAGSELFRCERHDGEITRLRFRPDGGAIASLCDAGLWVWDAVSGKLLGRVSGSFEDVLWSPDGTRLAMISKEESDGGSILLDAASLNVVTRLPAERKDLRDLRFAGRGKFLLAAPANLWTETGDVTFRVIDVGSGATLRDTLMEGYREKQMFPAFEAEHPSLLSLAPSQGKLALLDLVTGARTDIEVQVPGLRDLCGVSEDGRYPVLRSFGTEGDRKVVWDVRNGKAVCEITGTGEFRFMAERKGLLVDREEVWLYDLGGRKKISLPEGVFERVYDEQLLIRDREGGLVLARLRDGSTAGSIPGYFKEDREYAWISFTPGVSVYAHFALKGEAFPAHFLMQDPRDGRDLRCIDLRGPTWRTAAIDAGGTLVGTQWDEQKNEIVVAELATGTERRRIPFTVAGKDSPSLSLANDGRRLAARMGDGLHVFDVEDGSEIFRATTPTHPRWELSGHPEACSIVARLVGWGLPAEGFLDVSFDPETGILAHDSWLDLDLNSYETGCILLRAATGEKLGWVPCSFKYADDFTSPGEMRLAILPGIPTLISAMRNPYTGDCSLEITDFRFLLVPPEKVRALVEERLGHRPPGNKAVHEPDRGDLQRKSVTAR